MSFIYTICLTVFLVLVLLTIIPFLGTSKTHSSAFDGLLSLIPAKYYYDDATQDQWQQKKKSKQEIKQNKRAKLNPESVNNANEYSNGQASAKDVMDNKAKKLLVYHYQKITKTNNSRI